MYFVILDFACRYLLEVQVILDLVNHQIVNILDLLNIFLHAKTDFTK